MDIVVIEIIVSVVISLCVTISTIAIAWGSLRTKVYNNTKEICEIKDDNKSINDKLIPVNIDYAKSEARTAELTRLVERLTEQITSLEKLTNDLTTEIAILKNK